MKIDNAFPSKYLKASDLQDREHSLAIRELAMETIGDGHKAVVYFKDREKGMVLNKTNANRIAHTYGKETDDWVGKEIVLYPDTTEFEGRTVECIRVRVPKKQAANDLPVDEIPF